jgi:pilus assembly protein CpaB
VAVPEGGYLTAGMLGGARAAGGPGPLRAGERALELAVAGGGALASAEPGSRVDVLVTSRREDGVGRTYVARENLELLGLRAREDEAVAADSAEGSSAATALATLRVGAREAVYLTAATTFANEVRLLVRPPGDRQRIGAAAVSEAGL